MFKTKQLKNIRKHILVQEYLLQCHNIEMTAIVDLLYYAVKSIPRYHVICSQTKQNHVMNVKRHQVVKVDYYGSFSITACNKLI